jgi:Tfp pilus assembly protein PilN
MGAISLNLATFEYRTRRVAFLLLLLTGLAAAGITLYSVHRGLDLKNELHAYEKRIEQLEGVRAKAAANGQVKAGKPLGQEAMRTIGEQASLVNQLIVSDVFPWDQLLNGLEKALPDGTILSSLRPSGDRKKITVTGRSRSTESLSRFMGGLDESGVIDRAALTKLHVERADGRSEAMVFEIEARLRPGPGY